jgi:hypothetical protein
VTEPAERSIKRLEEHLEGAERTLSSLRSLDRGEAERVSERMDRLASQLLAVTEPRSMAEVHGDLGTEHLDEGELTALMDEMSPSDREG